MGDFWSSKLTKRVIELHLGVGGLLIVAEVLIFLKLDTIGLPYVELGFTTERRLLVFVKTLINLAVLAYIGVSFWLKAIQLRKEQIAYIELISL